MCLESTSLFSPSTLFQSLCLWLAYSCSYHIFSLCQLTTLTNRNSVSLSLPAQELPLSQTFPTIDSLPAPGLNPQALLLTVSSEYLGWFLFLVSSLLFFRSVPCGRLSWLYVSFWAHVNIVHHIISYRNTLSQSYSVWRPDHCLKCWDGGCYVRCSIWAVNSHENHWKLLPLDVRF